MARGKQTCKILKEIRRQIAEANNIEYVTSECRYKGDCHGTCPKCEAEVRYLEQQLRKRQLMGKAVVLAGLSSGMILFSGCGDTSNQKADDSYRLQGEPTEIVEEDIEPIGVQDNSKEGEAPLLEDSIIVKKGEIEEPLITVGEIIDPENPEKKTSYIDTPPSFPGGDTKLYEYISQNLIYPANAMDSHIQGRVIVSFIVKPDGSIADAKITKGVDTDLDNEALRVVKGLPKFNPAQLDGKAVESQFVLPIVFKLADE